MAMTGFFHHIGTFFLLVATALLLVTTITAPVVNDMAILKVDLGNRTSSSPSSVNFGTFGYCVTNSAETNDDDDYCTSARIGYNPLKVLSEINDLNYNDASENTSKALTRVMVLHPVATVLSFIAFLLALGSGFIGALFAASVSTLAFIVTVVVIATDFTSFGIVRREVNEAARNGAEWSVKWSTGIWTLVAALVCLLLATVIVLLTCCSARLHKKRASRVSKDGDAGYTTTTTKRKFWQRRSRY